MSNGFPTALYVGQNNAYQTTYLFAGPYNDVGEVWSGNQMLWVGPPEGGSAGNVDGIIGWGSDTGSGVVGLGGQSWGTGVVGFGGVNWELKGAGGTGVQGIGGEASWPNPIAGVGVEGDGGAGFPGYSQNGGEAPSTTPPRDAATGVHGFGGDINAPPANIIEGTVVPAKAGVGVVGQGGSGGSSGPPGSGVAGHSPDDSNIPSPFDVSVGNGVAGQGPDCGVFGFSGTGVGVKGVGVTLAGVYGINQNPSPSNGAAAGVLGVGPIGGAGVVGSGRIGRPLR
jgi:hypothetical protein